MWTEGIVNGYEYSTKVFDEASSMGINNGRISKLDVKKGGKLVFRYDRGWDKRPATAADKKALKAILSRYPV